MFKKSIKEYKIITSDDCKTYPTKEKEKTLNYVARTGRKDLWVEKEPKVAHYRTMKRP